MATQLNPMFPRRAPAAGTLALRNHPRPFAGPLRPSTRSRLRIAVAALLGSSPVLAAPTGGVVTTGTATVTQNGSVTSVDQSSNKASINWQSFSVGSGEAVNFNQPGAASITLNRVVGNEKSVIEGALNANGQVFLINSNGVLFARGSQISTAGLVASTLDLNDDDFQAGNYTFKAAAGTTTATVVNQGSLRTSDGGYVALLGKQVTNDGVIVATKGTAALAAGNQITLTLSGPSLLSVNIDQGVLDGLVENRQAIYADGGKVLLTAKAADNLMSAQVNSSGIVQARTLDDLKGSIVLRAEGGTTTVSGTLDASSPTHGDGGAIETSGTKIAIADSAIVGSLATSGTTGTWTAAADGLTVAPSGGSLSGAALGAGLAANHVALTSTASTQGSSTGDLIISDPVSWATDTKLTLSAAHDISVNAPIVATGTNAGLALSYQSDYHILTPAAFAGTVLDANGLPTPKQAPAGTPFASITLSGQSASLSVNGQAYTLVHSMDQLAALDDATGTATGSFALAQDLDATAWSAANPGTAAVIKAFTGTLAGLGHTVSHLTLGKTGLSYVGLVARGNGPTTFRDIGLLDANVQGTGGVGTLAGYLQASSKIADCYATGTVTAGQGTAGGLIGMIATRADRASVTRAWANVEVQSPSGNAGGLIGVTTGTVAIDSANALGNVTASAPSSSAVGGLIGSVTGSVSNSYATGKVTAGQYAGGLLGSALGASGANIAVTNSFATGNVEATASTASTTTPGRAGGLIGYANFVDIGNSFALGSVRGVGTMFTAAGGLVGYLDVGSVDHSHAAGQVFIGGSQGGGLVGAAASVSVSNSYASGDVNGSTTSIRIGGLVGAMGVSDKSTADSSIASSSASGNVTGMATVGGLAGLMAGSISGSSASGNVTGSNDAHPDSGSMGGLVGGYANGTISDSSATGSVTGSHYVGGLVGIFNPYTRPGSINNSWASGTVNGSGVGVGGLVGESEHKLTINNSYWNVDSTGQTKAVGALFDDQSVVTLTQSQGLTGQQFSDLRYYLDGTITQVLLDRALAELAETKKAAAEAAAEADAKLAAALAAVKAAEDAAAQTKADAAAQLAAAQAAVEAANQAAAQAAATAAAQVATAQAAAEAAQRAAADAVAKGASDAAAQVAAAQAAAQAAIDAATRAAAQAVADAAAQVAAAQAAADAATQLAAKAQADAAAQAAAARGAAQAAIDAANQAATKTADAAAQVAAAQAAADAANAAAAKAATDSAAAQATADAAKAAAAKTAADAAAQVAAAQAATEVAKAAAAKTAGDAAAQVALAQAAAEAAKQAAAQASSDAATQATATQSAATAAASREAAEAAARNTAQAAALQMQQARAATAGQQGALQLAQATPIPGLVGRNSRREILFTRAPILQNNIVFSEAGRYSSAVERFEVGGKVYQLKNENRRSKASPSPKSTPSSEQAPGSSEPVPWRQNTDPLR